MPMFIWRAPTVILVGQFMKTLFTRAATANGTLMALIYTIELIYLKAIPSVFFKKKYLVHFRSK